LIVCGVMKLTMSFKILVLLLLTQLACSQSNKQVEQTIAPEKKSNAYTLNLGNREKQYNTEIDLKNKSKFREVEYSESGLIVLTSFGEYQLFKENTDTSWSEVKLTDEIYCLDFLDRKNGWAVNSDGETWQTIDGAVNWNRIGNLSSKALESSCETLQFTSSQIGWLADFTGLFKTSDGGKTWNRVPQVSGDVAKLFFENQINGWAIAVDENNNTTIYRTSDDGASWTFNKTKAIAIDEMFLQNSNEGWLIGKAGTEVYRTVNGGKTLEKIPAPENKFVAKSIFCLDNQSCFIAGYTYKNDREFNPSYGTAALFKTSDDGQNWLRINFQTDEHFFEIVKFFDSGFGILAAQNKLYKTTDGGTSWEEILKLKQYKEGTDWKATIWENKKDE
jgi:photosystem II stability/assembly factor-like uncharacterized protein